MFMLRRFSDPTMSSSVYASEIRGTANKCDILHKTLLLASLGCLFVIARYKMHRVHGVEI